MLVYFFVTEHRLRNSRFWISIPVVLATMTNKLTP